MILQDLFENSIKLSDTGRERAVAWIEKVYNKFPATWQNNHVMTWGEGEDQQFAMFELVPSLSKKGAVEVKWFQAYPLRQGVGSRAMRVLQDLAKEDNIALTLYPWDKGQVSQSKLTKFYKGQGFKSAAKGSKNMYWEPQINESLSQVAFHYTNTYTAAKILNSGVFQLSSSLGSIEQQYAPKGMPYFLSTTRSRQGGYHKTIGPAATLFVLDGNWFNQHYVSRPIDYWENRNPQVSHHRTSEAEDRVFSKEPTIPIDGVTAVHMYCDPGADAEVKAVTRQALITAKRLGIPAYFYTDSTAWRNFDTRKQGDVSMLTGKERGAGYFSRHKGFLVPWLELMQAKNKSQLSKRANDIRYNLQYTYDKGTAYDSLKTDFSNARRPSGGADRENAVKIIKFMQQNKLSTLEDFVNFLAAKWKALGDKT